MKLVKMLNPKKIAVYTTIAFASSFFIVGCDNSTEKKIENSTVNQIEISSPLFNDVQVNFIKNSLDNFINNYNLKQTFATISLDSFDQSKDNKEISIVISIAMTNLDSTSNQPIIINSTYVITPAQSINKDAVAKFDLKNSVLIKDQSTIDKNSFSSFVKQVIETIGLTNNGFILVSGDLKTTIKTDNTLNYLDSKSYGEENSINIKPFVYSYQTKNNLELIDINYQFPAIEISADGLTVSLNNLNVQELNHSFNDNFSYTGQDSYKIDSIDVRSQKEFSATFQGINLKVNSNISNGFVDQSVSSSFSGNITNSDGKKTDLIVDSNVKVENINLAALKAWLEYIQSTGFYSTSMDNTKLELINKLFKDGFSILINDTSIEIDGAKGHIDFRLEFSPMDISNSNKPMMLATQLINNITIEVNSFVPTSWFTTFGIAKDPSYTDLMIKQAIQQIDAIGYKGAVTYDGKNINIHFDIKKGNVFVNGELKGSLFNVLSMLM